MEVIPYLDEAEQAMWGAFDGPKKLKVQELWDLLGVNAIEDGALSAAAHKVLEDARAGVYDAELGRPRGNTNLGFAWDISRKHGEEWYERFSAAEGSNSIEAFASKHGVGSVELLVAAVARWGRPPDWPARPDKFAKKIESLAIKLKNRRATESLDDWFGAEFSKMRGIPLTRRPSDVIRATEAKVGDVVVRGWTPPLGSVTGARLEGDSVYAQVETLWDRHLPAIKKLTDEEVFLNRHGEEVSLKGGSANLLAVLVARGITPKQIDKDLRAKGSGRRKLLMGTARVLARSYSPESMSLDDWFAKQVERRPAWRRTKAGPAKGLRPSQILEGVPLSMRAYPSLVGDDPDRVIKGADGKPVKIHGVPLTQSYYQDEFQKYATLSQWYRGDRPTKEEVIRWLRDGNTEYQVAKEMTQDLGKFLRSDMWKSRRQGLVNQFNAVIGGWEKLPTKQKVAHQKLMRKAVLFNWSPSEYGDHLMGTNAYVRGNDFRNKSGALESTYAQIMGGPITDSVRTTIGEAVLARMSPDSFASWIRSQPEYGSSIEMQKRMNKLSYALADMTGSTPSLVRGVVPNPPAAFAIPDSPRIPGGPALTEGGTQRVQAGLEGV